MSRNKGSIKYYVGRHNGFIYCVNFKVGTTHYLRPEYIEGVSRWIESGVELELFKCRSGWRRIDKKVVYHFIGNQLDYDILYFECPIKVRKPKNKPLNIEPIQY